MCDRDRALKGVKLLECVGVRVCVCCCCMYSPIVFGGSVCVCDCVSSPLHRAAQHMMQPHSFGLQSCQRCTPDLCDGNRSLTGQTRGCSLHAGAKGMSRWRNSWGVQLPCVCLCAWRLQGCCSSGGLLLVFGVGRIFLAHKAPTAVCVLDGAWRCAENFIVFAGVRRWQ